MKIGDKTKEVWIPEGVITECEYLGDLGNGRLLFYDTIHKCFRAGFLDLMEGNVILNGWETGEKPSDLINKE